MADINSELKRLEAAGQTFAMTMIKDHLEREKYRKMIQLMSKDILQQVQSRRKTPQQGAAIANRLRNEIMDAARGRQSAITRSLSEFLKKEGKSLAQLQEYYSTKNFNIPFAEASKQQKKAVWKTIIERSGIDRGLVTRAARSVSAVSEATICYTLAVPLLKSEEWDYETQKVFSREVWGLNGAWMGAKAGTFACAPAGPWGSLVCAISGGIAGSSGMGLMFDQVFH